MTHHVDRHGTSPHGQPSNGQSWIGLPTFRYGRPDETTLVDADVAELIGDRRLTVQAGYVFVGSIALHRFVMGCVKNDGKVVHHVNEEKFDNRRANLVVCNGSKEHARMAHPKMMALLHELGQAARR